MKKTLAKLRNGEPATIVAIGDSITENTFHTRGRMNWVSLLDEAIFETYGNGVCQVINSGKCGTTYEEALTRIDHDVIKYGPDLVILSFGMNDAGKGMDGIEAFKQNAKTLISRVREACNCEFLVRTPNPQVAPPGAHIQLGAAPGAAFDPPGRPLKAYAAALVDLATELNCEVVDHYTLWAQAKFTCHRPVSDHCGLWLRMADTIHPNWQGHLTFYREIADKFDTPRYFPWEDISK